MAAVGLILLGTFGFASTAHLILTFSFSFILVLGATIFALFAA